MSEEKKETTDDAEKTTDDGQPTTDAGGLNKDNLTTNEKINEIKSLPGTISETGQTLDLKPLNDLNDDMEVHHHTHTSH